MQITSNEIRQKYIEFFKSKNHAIIPSASLVPENDPTVLFNTAGMQPLVPYLLGEKHPAGNRLANFQKCIRTNDIEDVGDNTHGTFFEMLGNWSLGDYFKKESITWSYEFLTSTEWLNINSKKIAVTVFEGDENAPRDDESAGIWKSLGINNISYLGKKDNWWGPAGLTGPCGPDTEIFYRVGKEELPPVGSTVGNDEKNWMEIWNNVFMEYIKDENGNFNKAKMQNVDTGMGLERITRTLTGAPSIYETDIFNDVIEAICKTLGVSYNEETKVNIRIIADHSRASVMMISDGILPLNIDQGYILRRLLRRSIRNAYKLGFKGQFLSEIAKVIIAKFENIYPQLKNKKDLILEEINKEEKQFSQSLEKGLKEFDKRTSHLAPLLQGEENRREISGFDAFYLFQSFGFPIEMTTELAQEKGLTVDLDGFNEAFKNHQELSRAGAEQKFKGGLADNSDETTALHSATHLMLAGLRKYLGTGVHQAGSNITAERLRFDFTHNEKVEKDILDKVEAFVNEVINANCEVKLEEVQKSQAENDPTIEGSFWEKYPEIVKVYTFADNTGKVYSRELCGGPHVKNTGNMGVFKIQKEEASSRGVRRIKAVLIK